ncbi:hypothetical protein ACFVSS_19180 [Peribacillus butanolivorans]
MRVAVVAPYTTFRTKMNLEYSQQTHEFWVPELFVAPAVSFGVKEQ